jgi:hypothetical protein
MPFYIPPAGHLLSAKTRLADALKLLDHCISNDANHVDLQQQADEISGALRLAADSVQRALTTAEAEAAMKRAEVRELAA